MFAADFRTATNGDNRTLYVLLCFNDKIDQNDRRTVTGRISEEPQKRLKTIEDLLNWNLNPFGNDFLDISKRYIAGHVRLALRRVIHR